MQFKCILEIYINFTYKCISFKCLQCIYIFLFVYLFIYKVCNPFSFFLFCFSYLFFLPFSYFLFYFLSFSLFSPSCTNYFFPSSPMLPWSTGPWPARPCSWRPCGGCLLLVQLWRTHVANAPVGGAPMAGSRHQGPCGLRPMSGISSLHPNSSVVLEIS